MARENKKLTTAFNKEFEDVTVTCNTNTEHEDVTPTSNDLNTLENVKGNIEGIIAERKGKKRVEDTHKRSTFLFRKDLQKRLDRLVKSKKEISKTLFINMAIEALLNEFED